MHRILPVLAVFVLGTAACAGAGDAGPADAVRDTLPNGAVRVRYDALPDTGPVVDVDLRIGAVDGDPRLVFGDVRSVEAGPDGTIYVLDHQASEVRAFDAAGRFLRIVARRGAGPGEITEANGMVLVDDGTLWIQDHGQWTMLGVSTDGRELGRVPMPVLSYGYVWNGAIDDRGRFWKPSAHSDAARQFPPEEGLSEASARTYFNVYDPATGTRDSVYLGDRRSRTFIARNARGGYSYWAIPYDPEMIQRVDPAGGFWLVNTAQYRIARLDQRGDTVLVIEAAIEPQPVTPEDRARWVATSAERIDTPLRTLQSIIDLAGGTHPVIVDLMVDDRDRLWVRRHVAQGDSPRYDIFLRDGTFQGSLALGFPPAPYLPIRVRGRGLYAITRDSMDVPYVVRATLPE